jgi:hypothetical protein
MFDKGALVGEGTEAVVGAQHRRSVRLGVVGGVPPSGRVMRRTNFRHVTIVSEKIQ